MFEFLELIRPDLGKPAPRGQQARLRVAISDHVALPTPLVAYDLPWCERPPETVCYVADQLDALGIAVAGLRSEFFQTDDADTQDAPELPLSICPYRPERYGLTLEDLQRARIIDVRLTAQRDSHGLPNYSAAAMRRWDRRVARMADRDMRSYGPMESLAWPPDVADLEQLPAKLKQLRELAPQAAISISIDAYRAKFDLPALLRSTPDLITLRADTWPGTHPQALAELITQAADLMSETGRPTALAGSPDAMGSVGATHAGLTRPSLALVPPPGVSELDVVKLLALGVQVIAIDGWCKALIQPERKHMTSAQWAAANLGVVTDAVDREDQIDLATLHARIDLVRQWVEAAGVGSLAGLGRQHLATYGLPLAGVRNVLNGVTNSATQTHQPVG